MNVSKFNAGRGVRSGISGVALIASLLAAQGAFAQSEGAAVQDAERDQGPAKVEANAEIVVTGTRVVRDGYKSPTPLTVLTAQDIQNSSPTNNLADFVNQLPSVANSVRPSNSRAALSNGIAGINTINLRNLDGVTARTLVLLDGRRSVVSNERGLVDVNTFPQALVSSVQVVTGGASAAYGSDAVAGVVNFVLDKKFKGLKLSADTGITGQGDGFNYSISGAAGISFADGRGHALLSGEWAHRDGIFQTDRAWNQRGLRLVANPAFVAGNGQPQFLRRYGAGVSNALPGGIINSSTAIAGSGVAANSLRGIYFGPGGSVNQYAYGTITDGVRTVGGDWMLNDSTRNVGLDAQEDRGGVFGRVSFELTPSIEIFAQASYNTQKTLFAVGSGNSTITSGASVTLRNDNAYLRNALGAARLAGINTVTIGTSNYDLGVRMSNNHRETQRYLIGAEGQFELFGKPAKWDVYGQYGRADTREQLYNITNTSRLALAADAVFAPAGNLLGVPAGTIVCRSSLTAPGNGCQPLNQLGTGVASPAAINYVLGDPYREQKIEQTVTGVNLSVTPFATWAGDVSVAVGAEYRKEKISGFVPTEFQSGWGVGNYLPNIGGYQVKEAYLETVVPVGLGLELNGAFRATDYSTSGNVSTWKVGATWQPIPDIRFRVTRSRDIRAPNLAEFFAAGRTQTTVINDPFRNNPATGAPPLLSVPVLSTTTGNTDLRPEVAQSLNLGVVLQPRFLPGFSASIDYFRIDLRNAIGSFGPQDIINLCFQGQQEFCAAYSVDPANPAQFLFRTKPFNLASQLVKGIDFEVSYRMPIGSDSMLALRALTTRNIDNILDTGIPGLVPINSVGALGSTAQNSPATPKWLYRVSATLDTPRFSMTATGRGIGSGVYLNTNIECQTGCPVTTTQFQTVDNNKVAGAFYADFNLAAKVEVGRAKGELFFNVTNLLDRDPILIPIGDVQANNQSDILGRAFRVGVRFQTK